MELKRILPPPLVASEQPSEMEWAECESELVRLPGDFKSFLETYGTGCIDGFIWIFNPASKNPNLNLLIQAKKQLSALEDLFRRKVETKAYPLYPETAGLLPFGVTDNGDLLFWRTMGPPDIWSVIVGHSRSPQYEEFETNMTGFISSVLNGTNLVAAFPEDFPSSSPSFKPYTSPNIYE
jgi:hypothetical protein